MTEKVIIGDSTLYHGDCMEVLQTILDCSVDAVVTDPPYGISYVSSRRKHGKTDPLANDCAAPVRAVPLMAGKVLDGGCMYLATRFDVSALWNDAMRGSGLTLKTPIFWDKGNHTSGDLVGDYGGQVEIFLFAHKGRHELLDGRQSNLWRVMRDPAGDHPTPKPVRLIERMVRNSVLGVGLVLDPFMGSGTTGVACANLGRKFIGIEIERKYFDIACERIEAAYAQGRLFA